jgi:hypothetical protein
MSKKVPVNICPETSARWDMVDVRVISTTHALCGSHAFQHSPSALRRIEVSTVSKIPGFTRISLQEFFTRCCNTSKPLIGAEYTEVFRCLHSQKLRGLRSGDRAGQLTWPPHPIHCSPKVCFRCCLIARRKWGGAPSCMNHMCCRWWRGTCLKNTGKSFTK